MSFNLLETVKNHFNSDFTNQASTSLGESSSGISKALSAIIPTGLAGILSKATSGHDGASSVLDMAKQAAGNLPSTPSLTAGQDNNSGGILSSLFGNNQSGIVSSISQYAGIKESSASSLLNAGVPSMMGILGKHVDQSNLSPSGLSDFLSSQKDSIMNAMPSGLSSLTRQLGLGSIGAAASSPTSGIKSSVGSAGSSASSLASNVKSSVVDRTQSVVDPPNGGAKWLLPLILILAAIALLWYFSRSCNKSSDTTTTTDTLTTKTDTAAAVAADTATGTIKVTLPNGKVLDANKGGIEDQLVTFLKSDWKSLSDDSLKSKWFNFDNLNFNTGKATLLPESEHQLDNIGEILKAFPDAKIKIGGYTDITGDAEANKKLSQDRADAAKDGLTKRGVGAQVTGADGYGSQFAKYPATATDAEKATDRHVSVSVRK